MSTFIISNIFPFFSHQSSFSINTDFFETNVLNLLVVISVLFFYGTTFINDLIQDRKLVILKSFRDTDAKLEEASSKLQFAKDSLRLAKEKAEVIIREGISLAIKIASDVSMAADEEIQRVKESNFVKIKAEEEKLISEVVL